MRLNSAFPWLRDWRELRFVRVWIAVNRLARRTDFTLGLIYTRLRGDEGLDSKRLAMLFAFGWRVMSYLREILRPYGSG